MSTPPQRTVLVVAYYFPPLGLSGVQRTLKFVKYLPQFGWQPVVLTVTPTGYYAQDYSLLDELLPHRIEVVRAGSLDPNRIFRTKGVIKMPPERWRKVLGYMSDFLFVPDSKIGWRNKAVKAALELHRRTPVDLIFATAPPFTDFLIGGELSAALGKPLVLDYRDPWQEYPTKYFPTPLHRIWNSRLERQVLHQSSRVITTNRRVKELILMRHGFLRYDDVTILPQGFDPGDFERAAEKDPLHQDTMRITHAGVFSGDRTPVHFLRALRKVLLDRPGVRGKIEATFVGTFQDEYRRMIGDMGLESDTVLTGYLEHAHCVRQLQTSDVLWFMVNNDKQSPGKMYEYLGAGKPILACAPDGFIRQTLNETGAARILAPDDVNGIAQAIMDYYDLFQKKQLPKPSDLAVQKYNRVTLTNELSKIFGFLAD